MFSRCERLGTRHPHLPSAWCKPMEASTQKARPADSQNQLFTYQNLSAQLEHAGADLILWPETSYPFVLGRDQKRDRLLGDLHRVHNGFQTPIIFGALTGSDGSPDPCQLRRSCSTRTTKSAAATTRPRSPFAASTARSRTAAIHQALGPRPGSLVARNRRHGSSI